MNPNKQSSDEIDDLLGKIKKVESPEFLLTHIHADLENNQREQVALPYAWGSALIVAILLVLNIWTIQTHSVDIVDNGSEIVIEGMNLMPDNGFY